ncbi:hypothetical protein MKW92_028062 [Papaver armeniacum]|nr:hypothetical protein MKW92_028062 [Papaver armeniacum]
MKESINQISKNLIAGEYEFIISYCWKMRSGRRTVQSALNYLKMVVRKKSKMESNKLVEPATDRKHHFFKDLQGETQNRVNHFFLVCVYSRGILSRLHTDSPTCKLAVFQGPNGASWIVEVNKTEKAGEGWVLFVQENGLKKFDFLVFRHDGGMQFHVKVFKVNVVEDKKVESKVKSFGSPFPFFWTSVKLFNVFRMTIPVAFAREHLPTNVKSGEEKMDVLLSENEESRIWDLRWKMFATENKVKIGDYVTFELIDKCLDTKFVINFHIYRVPVVEDDFDQE